MNTKRAGWAFLWMTVAFIAASLIVSAFIPYMGVTLTAVISELCLLVPAIYYLSKGRVQLAGQLHLKGIRLSTVLMVLVYHICCYPAVIAMNSFSMAISGENAALDITSDFAGESFFAIWLFVGLVGPVVEELVFRGIILGGLRTTGRILSAIILSALMFGLIHMNINQFSYTIIMGIFWGLLVEATGSIIPSVICHIFTNSTSVLLAYLLDENMGEIDEMLSGSGAVTASSYAVTGTVFLVIAVFTTMLAMLMLRVISLNEGRTGCFDNIFRKKSKAERYGSLFSIPLVVGIIMSAVVTVWVFISGSL